MTRFQTGCALVVAGGTALVLGMTVLPDLLHAVDTGVRIPPRGGPAPLIGIGLPIAGAVLATVYFARRFRRKE